MKTLMTFAFIALFSIASFAQQSTDKHPVAAQPIAAHSSATQQPDVAFLQAMGQALGQWQQAKTPEARQAALNTFDRIAAAKPEEWLPAYYAALMRMNEATALSPGDKMDDLLNQVLTQVDAQLGKHSNNSELLALKGYRHMIYVASDPMTRGQQYSGSAIQALQQAIHADPANPRAYLLLGRMKLGLAQFMNSSTAEACELLGKSVELYASTSKERSLQPAWGEGMATEAAGQCAAAE